MNFAWLISLGLFFAKMLSWFRGKGYRINLEVRPEAVIEADRKKNEVLRERIKNKRAEMVKAAVKASRARADDRPDADDLDDELHKIQDEYDALTASLDN